MLPALSVHEPLMDATVPVALIVVLPVGDPGATPESASLQLKVTLTGLVAHVPAV